MPGVPSGRGCEECRKQKKKCDQINPSCSRCTRLDIPCIGSGQRRYKFVKDTTTKSKTKNMVIASNSLPVPQIQWIPSSETTMVRSAICFALSVTDFRYDLSVYGEFLQEIPRRLGTNAALDASAYALTATLACVRSKQQSLGAFEGYVKALKALRMCISDPVEAKSANTLCSIYLLMLCQTWGGQRGDFTGHAKAVAYLLRDMTPASDSWECSFEAEVATTLCIHVIIESIGDPSIRLDPWLQRLTKSRDQSSAFWSMKFGNIAKFPNFIRNPAAHLDEIELVYQILRAEIPRIRQYVFNFTQRAGSVKNMHPRFKNAYGVALSCAIILNAVLCSFGFDDRKSLLCDESGIMADEIISLAENAIPYRPLGACHMRLFLISAWAGTHDKSKRLKAGKLLAEYKADFAIAKWVEMALWLRAKLNNHSHATSGFLEDDSELPIKIRPEPCSTM